MEEIIIDVLFSIHENEMFAGESSKHDVFYNFQNPSQCMNLKFTCIPDNFLFWFGVYFIYIIIFNKIIGNTTKHSNMINVYFFVEENFIWGFIIDFRVPSLIM